MSMTHHQLRIPPMEVPRVSSAQSVANRDANPVSNATAERVGNVNLVDVALLAAKRVGYYDKELADIFGLSKSDFSKGFDHNDDTRNKPMKAQLPKHYAEAFVRTMAEMLGLEIGGSAERSRAFANLMQACADVVKAGQP